ncbi:MAG: FliH/SctL family protein [Bacillota bacterium]
MPLSPKVLRVKDTSVGDKQIYLDLKHQFVPAEDKYGAAARREGLRLTMEEARQHADLIVHKAWAEAESIIQKTRIQSAVQVLEEAAKARDEGYRDGYRQGLEEAAAEAERVRRQARDVLRAAEEERRKTLRELESELLQLAREMAEKIIHTQLNLDPGLVLEIVRESIALAESREKITVYVNPGELELFEEHHSELKQLLPGNAFLCIIPDGVIKPGGCRLETGSGEVDASLETRWQALWEQICEKQA